MESNKLAEQDESETQHNPIINFGEIAGTVVFLVGFAMLPAGFVVGPAIAETDLPAALSLIVYTVTAFTLIFAGGWYSNYKHKEADTDA